MAKKGRINILSFLLVMKAEEADRYMLCTPKRTEWKAHGKNILRKKDLKHVVVEGGGYDKEGKKSTFTEYLFYFIKLRSVNYINKNYSELHIPNFPC